MNFAKFLIFFAIITLSTTIFFGHKSSEEYKLTIDKYKTTTAFQTVKFKSRSYPIIKECLLSNRKKEDPILFCVKKFVDSSHTEEEQNYRNSQFESTGWNPYPIE